MSSNTNPSVPSNKFASKAAERRDYIAAILNKPAFVTPHNSKKQSFSKRIVLSAQSEYFPVTCDYTGSVAALHIPAIPGKVLSYVSPLALLPNARGIAAEGSSYLNKLETQTLAAVLITLADDYELFRYQPTDSGAQKNAILRTVGKSVLIDCILFIENHVHSGNAFNIPTLSLILDVEVAERGIEVRMVQWLKLLAERLIESVVSVEEEDAAIAVNNAFAKKHQIAPQTVRKAKKEAVAKQREFRVFKKEAKVAVASLFSSQVISSKLRDYLSAILTGDMLVNAADEMVTLICTKLRELDSSVATKLAQDITHFYIELNDIVEAKNEFETLAPAFSEMPAGKYLNEVEAKEENEFDAPSVEAQAKPALPLEAASVVPNEANEANESKGANEAVEKKLTFVEKLKLKREAALKASASNAGDF